MQTLIQIQTQTPALMVKACQDRLVTMGQLRRRAILAEAESAGIYCFTTRCFIETVQQIEIWLRDPVLIERLEPAEYLRLQDKVSYQVIKFGEYLAVLSTSFSQELEDHIFIEEGAVD